MIKHFAPILVAVSCYAAPVQSPRLAELFPQPSRSIIEFPPMPSAASAMSVLPPPVEHLHAEWESVASADSYTLYAGTNSGVWPIAIGTTEGLSMDFDLIWPDGVDRWFFTVRSKNGFGESGPSRQAFLPDLPATHVVISWTGPRTNIFQASKLRTPWQLLTNSVSPVIVPIQPGSKFFTAGVPLKIAGTNFTQ